MSAAYHIAQLRHAYAHLIREGRTEFARGLISPSIQCFERLLAFDPATIEAFDAAESARVKEKWAKRSASGILTEGGDVKQAPGESLSSPVAEPDAQPTGDLG